jgi:hypothetical protein
MNLVTTAFLSYLASQATTTSPKPSCLNESGEPVRFMITGEYFVDHSSEGWTVSVDDKGFMVVRTSEGTRRLGARKSVVAALRAEVRTQDLWSLPRDVPGAGVMYRRIELCSVGRTHAVTHFYRPAGTPITEQDIRFIRVFVKLRRLFVSKSAADVQGEEEYLQKLGAPTEK